MMEAPHNPVRGDQGDGGYAPESKTLGNGGVLKRRGQWLEQPPPAAEASVRPASDQGQRSHGGTSVSISRGCGVFMRGAEGHSPELWEGVPAALTTPLPA